MNKIAEYNSIVLGTLSKHFHSLNLRFSHAVHFYVYDVLLFMDI